MPLAATKPKPDVRVAVEAMKELRRSQTLGSLCVREMIEEGRSFWQMTGIDASKVFVSDRSMTSVCGFADKDDQYAVAILDNMPEFQDHVPSLWPLEVANALLVGERRGRTTPASIARFLALLGTFPIDVDDETVARAWIPTVHLGRYHNLSD
jgi:hypothetical protein